MFRINKIFIFIAVLLGLYSCTPAKSLIAFEILQPSAITYPETVQSIGYLNRSPRTIDSFKGVIWDSMDYKDLIMLDTIYCYSITGGFEEGKKITRLPYMDDLVYLNARQRGMENSQQIPSEHVSEICTSFELDALITQDFYELEFDRFVQYSGQSAGFEDIISLIQDVKWTVYIPGMEKPLDEWQFHDTLYFVNLPSSPDSIKKHTPMSALKEGGKEVGYSFGLRNIPVWLEISRIVYLGHNKELKQATKHTNKGDWEGAKEIWEDNLKSEDEKLAAKCAYNIALYYELEDDIDMALQYATQAKELWPSAPIRFYIEELGIRQQNRDDLAIQLRIAE